MKRPTYNEVKQLCRDFEEYCRQYETCDVCPYFESKFGCQEAYIYNRGHNDGINEVMKGRQ